MADPVNIQQALDDLDHPYLAHRLSAIQALTDAKHEAALPNLIEIALDKNRDERTRAGAVKALGKIGGETALDALIELSAEIPPSITATEPRVNAPQTQSLTGLLVSIALAAAFKSIGTPRALAAMSQWQKGRK